MKPAKTSKVPGEPPDEEELAVRLDERLRALREEVMAQKGSWEPNSHPFARNVALWRARQPGRSIVQVRASLLLELVKIARIHIPPRWRLAGQHLPGHLFGREKRNGPCDAAALADFGLSEEEVRGVQACLEEWEWARSLYAVGETDPAAPGSEAIYWGRGWMENHSIRDYAKVLAVGFEGIREEIEAQLASTGLDDPERPQKENLWRAGLRVCEAGCLLGARYAEAAARLAEGAGDDAERRRLEGMAEACRRVPARGARTLFEAVQALWLAHILTCGEDGINANSIGRLDQILGPFYEADLRAGRISRAEAVVLMEELACKLYLDYDVQAITLGGVDARGGDAANAMTHILLEATRNVGFVRDVSVRLHDGSPPELHRACAELVARGGGIPFLFNDECFIPALADHGIGLEDARDYAPIGCIELTIPGRANPHAVSGWFNSTKCLELALFDGCDPRTGEALGPRTGLLPELGSYEALWEAYGKQVAFFADRMVYHCNRGELAQREAGPLPCWSVLTDDCIARGRDITDGGAVYNYHGICFLGMANTADSLCALKKLLFDEKVVAAEDLLEALRADFEGYEALRQRLLSGAPNYGNDCEEVDVVAAEVAHHFIDLMDRARSPLGGRYFVHLFSFLCNLDFGKGTGATPDGRRAGEPLAYSLSAHQGRDQEGVTAMLNSLARIPHHRAAGASAAIVDLDPKLVAGKAGLDRLVQIIQTAVRMRVGQLQFNVVTAERLRLAQEDPERFGNIPVRVAGYSQKFNLLTSELQDHVIARTKHIS